MMKLNCRAVVVTGGASGVGHAKALLLARDCGEIAVGGVDEEASLRTAGDIPASGGRVTWAGPRRSNRDGRRSDAERCRRGVVSTRRR